MRPRHYYAIETPPILRLTASDKTLRNLCAVEVYRFDSEQERDLFVQRAPNRYAVTARRATALCDVAKMRIAPREEGGTT